MNIKLRPQRKSKITNNIITNNGKNKFEGAAPPDIKLIFNANLTDAGGNPAIVKHSILVGVEKLIVA